MTKNEILKKHEDKNEYHLHVVDRYWVMEAMEEYHQEQLALCNVSNWVAVENGLPNELETVWISNGKGWTTLGCLVYAEGGWHWAETNGVIYQKESKIVSECESDDLDVKFWHRLPESPCL